MCDLVFVCDVSNLITSDCVIFVAAASAAGTINDDDDQHQHALMIDLCDEPLPLQFNRIQSLFFYFSFAVMPNPPLMSVCVCVCLLCCDLLCALLSPLSFSVSPLHPSSIASSSFFHVTSSRRRHSSSRILSVASGGDGSQLRSVSHTVLVSSSSSSK